MLFITLTPPADSLLFTTQPILTEVASQQQRSLSVDSMIANPMTEIPAVSQLSDIQPSDWLFQALQSLVTGYTNQRLQEHLGMTRYEFAAALNTFLDFVQKQKMTQNIAQKDLVIIKRMQSEFTQELAILANQKTSLETRISHLESYQFSPTVTLSGEVILAISDDIGDKTNDNLAVQYRTQLGLRTSFTGKDRLRISLRSGNGQQFSYLENLTREGRLGFDSDTDNQLQLSKVSYEFPIGDRIKLFLAPVGDDVDVSNPFFSDRGTGSISRFGRQNPIYRLIESGGIGLEYQFSEQLTLSLGYYNQESENSEVGNGLFNGNYSASVKLEWQPTEEILLGLLYVHSYNDSNLATGTGSLRSQLDLNRPIIGNSYSLEVACNLSPQFVIGGWIGFTNGTVINLGKAEVWNYAFTLAWLDLGKEGNQLGIVVGQEPKLTRTSGFLIDSRRNDPHTSLHIEAFYRYQIQDNLSITPGLIWITAPDHNNDNGDFAILTIRTTLEF